MDSTGLFLSPASCSGTHNNSINNFVEMYAFRPEEIEWPTFKLLGNVTLYSKAVDDHVKAILSLPQLDIKAVEQRKLVVCLDTVNGKNALVCIMLQVLEE